MAVALTVTGSTLAAPLLTPASPANATLSATLSEAPSWLKATDITVNPPGPLPGSATAPAVKRGYVITGDQLAKYDITATAAAQQALTAFAARAKQNYGVTLNLPLYRVYATPPIMRAGEADLVKQLLSIVLELQQVIPDVDPPSTQEVIDTVFTLVGELREQIGTIRIQGAHDDFLDAPVDAELAFIKRALDNLPDPSDIDPGSVIDPNSVSPQTYVDQVIAIVNSLQPTLDTLVQSLGLPSNEEIQADPTHAAPVGTDTLASTIEGDDGVGSVLVLPTATAVDYVGAAWDEGMVKVTNTLETTPAGSLAPTVGTIAQDPSEGSQQWRPAGGLGCTSRKQNDTAWYDTCTWWYELAKDGNSARQTWALEQYGTGKSKRCCHLKSLYLDSDRKKGSPDQDWLRWSPTADSDYGNCATDTVGVNVNSFYVEHSETHCEKWDIDKGEQPASFENAWRGSVGQSERSTASLIATNTPNNYLPTDVVSFDYYAW